MPRDIATLKVNLKVKHLAGKVCLEGKVIVRNDAKKCKILKRKREWITLQLKIEIWILKRCTKTIGLKVTSEFSASKTVASTNYLKSSYRLTIKFTKNELK